ncbi:MAG: HAD-IB family phosphatase [Pseudomonadota bacterium]
MTVLIDFDGTIASYDTVDRLLAKFADPAWRDVERRWVGGEITSRACMADQIAMMQVSPADLDAFIDQIEIDRGIFPLLDACAAIGAKPIIVSDGVDRTIHRVLARDGLQVAVRANRMKSVGADRWTLEFPFADAACAIGAGNCKCATAATTFSVMIGDGRSDFCVAERADIVFAKDKLAQRARDTGLPHIAFGSLSEVADKLPGLVQSAMRPIAVPERAGVEFNG